MRQIKLYIATSLDGYIATPDGEVEWLTQFPNTTNDDYKYNELLQSIDIVLMGGRTYREIIGFGGEWSYRKKQTYVVSHKNINLTPKEPVQFITESINEEITKLKNSQGRDIWLVGGGELVSMLIDLDLIDEMQICVFPIILGQGIPLFPNKPKEKNWKLKSCRTFQNGAILSTYYK